MVSKRIISETVQELLRKSETSLPRDVEKALQSAYKAEDSDIAKAQLKAILDNVKYARDALVPICQDTGLPVFFAEIGSHFKFDAASIESAIAEGIRKATVSVPLRPNVVHPLTRENSGDNTGAGVPVVKFGFIADADYLELTCFPKGAGSENMSSLRMLNPSEGIRGIKRFVLETVASAGGNSCPPTIIGIGIGGSADEAMLLSKKALLRRIGSKNRDRDASSLEKELLCEINGLGIGPMGLGGRTTALSVNVELAYCHTASLPVALSMQCWAGRIAKARIYADRVEFAGP